MEFSGPSVFRIIILIYSLVHETIPASLRCYRSSINDFDSVPLEQPEPLIESSTPCLDVTKCTSVFVFGFTGNTLGFAVTTLIPTTLINLSSINDYDSVPLEQPEPLIESSTPCLDVTKCTSVFVFGFGGNTHGFAVTTLMPTLINLRKCNVMLLDWEQEAGGGGYGEFLGYPLEAVPATKRVGELFGEALLRMIDMGLKQRIHIIAHSLGAHLAGYTGRKTQLGGFQIPWITALDPARLEFEPPILTEPIDKTCASFVDAVHCDPGGYGMSQALGHVDFWPNYEKFVVGNRRQPGCKRSNALMDVVVNGNMCNHNRCIELYNVSLTETMILEGEGAINYLAWSTANDDAEVDTNFIGPMVDTRNEGNFYLTTGAVYPFGMGPAGLSP